MTRPIAIFAGPSLPPELRLPDPRLRWLPPASAGDLLSLAADPPGAICLIDGYFDHRPAPWHKEILHLLARGVRVFGASSIGALRAAELAPFGMVGVGAIFEAYRSGRLTGDDEVALVHAPAAFGWTPLTVPMVEVRATLHRARRLRLLDASVARRMNEDLHGLHFADRDWARMTAAAVAAKLTDAPTMRRLERLHVPVKRCDALACLAAAARAGDGPRVRPAPPPQTCFIDTLVEERGIRLSGSAESTSARNRSPDVPAIG